MVLKEYQPKDDLKIKFLKSTQNQIKEEGEVEPRSDTWIQKFSLLLPCPY